MASDGRAMKRTKANCAAAENRPFAPLTISSDGVQLAFKSRRTELSVSAGYFQNHIGGSFCRASDFGEACLTADFGEPLFARLSAKAEADFLR